MAFSLSSLLPKPKHSSGEAVAVSQPRPSAAQALSRPVDDAARTERETSPSTVSEQYNTIIRANSKKEIPPYGKRSGYMPRHLEDFGDGGAFPEIFMAQFPLGMGKKATPTTSNAVPLTVDASGRIQYDTLVKLGHAKGRVIHAKHTDMIPKNIAEDTVFSKPSDEDVQKTTEATRLALEKIIDSRIQSSKPKTVNVSSREHTLIKYTPSQQGAAFNSGAGERIIRMVEQQIDPMDPAKFKHKRVPRGPPSPPPPVLHSPPRPATVEEQKAWVIPPSISNWKNPKGYTIPLDKRLASDGRGLQEIVVNEKFALFAESLYIAENHSRQEVETRNALERKLAEKEKRDKEEALRFLAQRSRDERAGLSAEMRSAQLQQDGYHHHHNDDGDDDHHDHDHDHDHDHGQEDTASLGGYHISTLEEREQIRREKARERERELRLSRVGAEQKSKLLAREQERDMSEKIALGVAQPTLNKETMYDQRLFNQSEGMASGFGAEDSYDLYDKALFSGSSANVIYKPKHGLEGTDDWDAAEVGAKMAKLVDTEKFIPEKGFKGTELASAEPRTGPVLFEKGKRDILPDSAPATVDPFGLDSFLQEAKKGKKPSTASSTSTSSRSQRSPPRNNNNNNSSSSSGAPRKNKYLDD